MYCSFSCQSLFSLLSFALLTNEIGILLSQALLTTDRMKWFPWLDSSPLRYAQRISFFAHLYCSFQLGRQYKQQEAAGERTRFSFSPDRKFQADKKVRIRQLKKFLCFYCAFIHVREFTYMCMADSFPGGYCNCSFQNPNYSEIWKCLSDPLQ